MDPTHDASDLLPNIKIEPNCSQAYQSQSQSYPSSFPSSFDSGFFSQHDNEENSYGSWEKPGSSSITVNKDYQQEQSQKSTLTTSSGDVSANLGGSMILEKSSYDTQRQHYSPAPFGVFNSVPFNLSSNEDSNLIIVFEPSEVASTQLTPDIFKENQSRTSISKMSSAGTAVQSMMRSAYSPAHSMHSSPEPMENHEDEGNIAPFALNHLDKPLDFSKPSSQTDALSKTPPFSSEEDEVLLAQYTARSAAQSRVVDPMELAKSLAAASSPATLYGSFPVAQKPKYVKNDHVFSTPSPSPPERTSHHHHHISNTFEIKGIPSPQTHITNTESLENAAAAANSNAAMASQMFGLLSQFAASSGQNVDPSASLPLLKALQMAGGQQQHLQQQQQAALISALMHSAQQQQQPNLGAELLKSLMSVAAPATSPKQISPANNASQHFSHLLAQQQQQMQSQSMLAASSQMSPLAHSNAFGSPVMVAAGLSTPQQQQLQLNMAALSSTGTGVVDSTSAATAFTHRASHSQSRSSPQTPISIATSVGGASSTFTSMSSTPAVNSSSKYTRPFKALYNNKPDSHALRHAQTAFPPAVSSSAAATSAHGSDTTSSILLNGSQVAYEEFRSKMLGNSTSTSSTPVRSGEGHQTHQTKSRKMMARQQQQHTFDDSRSVGSSNCSSSDGHESGLDNHDQQSNSMMVASFAPAVLTSSPQTTNSCISPAISTSSGGGQSVNLTNSNSPGNSGGNSSGSRKRGRPLPEDLKDEAYWERRRKNNEAAKRSRDLRRAKEDEIAIRAAFLEQENLKLRCELAQALMENDKIRALWLGSQQGQNGVSKAAQTPSQLSPTSLSIPDQAALAAVMMQMKQSHCSPK